MLIAMLLTERMATLKELQTYYGAEDAYDMLEVCIVRAYNDAIAQGAD